MTTPSDAGLNDLCGRLREDAARWSDEMVMSDLEREAADAIEALKTEVERTDARCEEVEDRYEQTAERALILEADNAALRSENARLLQEVLSPGTIPFNWKELKADNAALRQWIDSNTTFYDVDADWPVEGPNIPTLAQVSNRIWYHATDDQESFPFSAVIDAAMREGKE